MPLSNLVTVVALRPSTLMPSASASWPRCVADHTRESDGTANWSLTTLQRALREAPDGLPEVSTYTIWKTLKEAGFDWQNDRSWCQTGVVERKGKVVEVIDPDATAKKIDRARLPRTNRDQKSSIVTGTTGYGRMMCSDWAKNWNV